MSKNLLFTLIALLLCTLSAQSQTVALSPVKNIFWSEAPLCGERNFVPETDEWFACQSAPSEDNLRYRQLQHTDLVIRTRLFYVGDYYIAELLLMNLSDSPKSLEMNDWHIIYYENEKAFLSQKAPVATKPIQHSPLLPEALLGASGSEVSNLGGRVVQNRSTGMNEIRVKNAASPTTSAVTRRSGGRTSQLKAKNIPAKTEIVGRAYFPLNEKPQFRLVVLKIDGRTYTFPVAKGKTAR